MAAETASWNDARKAESYASSGAADDIDVVAAAVGDGGGRAVVAVEGVVAAAVHGWPPLIDARMRARTTTAEMKESVHYCQHCCNGAAAIGTCRNFAVGNVPGFLGMCWFSWQGFPSELAPAVGLSQDCCRFVSDLVSSS